jgi:mannitol/fructose-specific phosphotransferase system IIA component
MEKDNEIFKLDNIVVNLPSEDRESCVKRCGKILLDNGYIKEHYIEGMLVREKTASTAIGTRMAIPHAEKEYKKDIIKNGLVLLTYPDGIDWGGQEVNIVIGIAAKNDDHVDILGDIVDAIDNEEDVDLFLKISDKQKIRDLFCGGPIKDIV